MVVSYADRPLASRRALARGEPSMPAMPGIAEHRRAHESVITLVEKTVKTSRWRTGRTPVRGQTNFFRCSHTEIWRSST